jgi:predicted  nucleic acid-binding Zn-ribbon protein
MLTMKPFRSLLVKFTAGASALAILAGLFLANPTPAFAQAPSPTPTPNTPAPATANRNDALKQAYQAEQTRLSTQETNLGKADSAVTRIQDLITKAKAKNVDTTALETALTAFQSQLASAKTAHATAGNILATHAGFTADGSVTDTAMARQTVQTARQSLVDCANLFGQALRDLRAAASAWRTDTAQALRGAALDKAFAAEQTRLDRQSTNLDKADNAVSKVQALIDQWSAKGVDVSFLQTLLSTFQNQIAAARGAHNTAQGILSSHAGFDANGKVTALDIARQTVQSARNAMQDAANQIGQSLRDLGQGLRTWRSEHRPTPTPAPTATPGSGA